MRILLVDDEAAVLNGIQFVLERFRPDYEVVAALQDPLEVERWLEQVPVDLVITDVKMPEMDGVELTRMIHTRYPEVFIIVFSAYSDFEYVRQCMKNGASDYMLKPSGYPLMLEMMDKIEQKVVSRKEQRSDEEAGRRLAQAFRGEREQLPSPWNGYETLSFLGCSFGADGIPVHARLCAELAGQLRQAVPAGTGMAMVEQQAVFVLDGIRLAELVESAQREQSRLAAQGYRLYLGVRRTANGPGAAARGCREVMRVAGFLEFNRLNRVMAGS